MSIVERLRAVGIQPWLEVRRQLLTFVWIERWPGGICSAAKTLSAILADEDERIALRNELMRTGCYEPKRPHPPAFESTTESTTR
jgi:hypothetical protein